MTKKSNQRLQSTRNIFNHKNSTTLNIVKKINRQVSEDYHKLSHIRGSILRASRQSTLERLRRELHKVASEMGHNHPVSSKKEKLLKKIVTYEQQNTFLRYGAINQAVINLCATYEDFIHRVIMKYYEEDIRRLKSNKQSVTNVTLVEALIRNDNIHHTLAENVADSYMRGSLREWHDVLRQNLGMNTTKLPIGLQEVFLVRNCLVHNNNKVSSQLNTLLPTRYTFRWSIPLTISDVERFKNELHASAAFIISEYTRLFPIDGGSWINRGN